MSKSFSAPQSVLELIDQYQNLTIGGKTVKTPYYIRTKQETHAKLQSLSGKGSPDEIITEALVVGKLRHVDFSAMSDEEIRNFLRKEHIGIDCSGYVYHLLNVWVYDQYHKPLHSILKYPYKGFINRIAVFLRPAMNTSVAVLTDPKNASRIKLKDAKPGDLIRMPALTSGDHVALIIKTTYDKAGQLKQITFTQSSQQFGQDHGVRVDTIDIIDNTKGLEDQKWNDLDKDGISWTLKQFKKDLKYSGIFRLKFFDRN